jgi:hypothetical protein
MPRTVSQALLMLKARSRVTGPSRAADTAPCNYGIALKAAYCVLAFWYRLNTGIAGMFETFRSSTW